MDIVRARGQDPETCRELFILAAEILGVAAVSVGVSRLKPAAPTLEPIFIHYQQDWGRFSEDQ